MLTQSPPHLVAALPDYDRRDLDVPGHVFVEPEAAITARDPVSRNRPTSRGELVVPGAFPYRVPFETRLEANWAFAFLARRDFARLESQPAGLTYPDAFGKERTYTPDFRLTLLSGVKIAIECKPKRRVSDALLDKLGRVSRSMSPGFADRLVVCTDKQLTPDHIHYTRLLHECRRDPEPAWDATIAELVAHSDEPATIGSMVADTGGAASAFRAIVRAVGAHLLNVCSRGRLDYPSEVVPAARRRAP